MPQEPPARPCTRCRRVLPADAFDWGDGRRGAGTRRYRRRVCRECLTAEATEKARWKAEHRVTFMRRGRLVRRCSRCRIVQDIERAFYVTSRDADGTEVRSYYCKACQMARQKARRARLLRDPAEVERERAYNREHKRGWRKQNQEKARAAQQRWRERMMADPVRHAASLEAQRITYRLRRERVDGVALADIRPIALRGPVLPEHDIGRLPALPLVAAIDRHAEREHLPREKAAANAGVGPRQVRAWEAGEIVEVQFDVADRVLTRLGLTWWMVFTPDGEGYAQACRAFAGEEAA